jgi:hypothetical protein
MGGVHGWHDSDEHPDLCSTLNHLFSFVVEMDPNGWLHRRVKGGMLPSQSLATRKHCRKTRQSNK